MFRLLGIWLLMGGLLSGCDPEKIEMAFAKVGEAELRLDLYQVRDVGEDRPLIIWIHGSAWRSGSRDSVPMRALVDHGFSIASVDYRLSTDAPFPANVHDVKAAIRFLRFHARKYRIDPNRISIAGASAGGHLAALMGLTNGSTTHEGRVGHELETSSDVQSIVSYYGASNLLSILDQSTPHGLEVRRHALELLLGGSPGEKLAMANLASPVEQLDLNDPPILLIHGDKDSQMPIEQSRELHAACAALGTPCELITIQGGKHEGRRAISQEPRGATKMMLPIRIEIRCVTRRQPEG